MGRDLLDVVDKGLTLVFLIYVEFDELIFMRKYDFIAGNIEVG